MNEANESPAPTHYAVVGGHLAELRGARGWRQDDVARAMQAAGCSWTRAVVASVEAGRRDVAVPEVAVLSRVFGVPVKAWYAGEGRVTMGEGATWELSALRDYLSGAEPAFEDERMDEPARRDPRHAEELMAAFMGAVRRNGPGEAEQVAARRLDRSHDQVVAASRALWGRTLTAERDARVDQQAGADASPRRLQAIRGHVTRGLYAELREYFDQQKGQP